MKCMKAYFTVEAMCVLPIMFGVYVFLIYGMFYQYDRCLLEQDVAFQAIKEQWEEPQQKQETQQYLVSELEKNTLKKEKGNVSAWANANILIPFGEIRMWTKNEKWELEASFTSLEVDPVEWVRSSRQIMEGIKNVTDRIREKP